MASNESVQIYILHENLYKNNFDSGKDVDGSLASGLKYIFGFRGPFMFIYSFQLFRCLSYIWIISTNNLVD